MSSGARPRGESPVLSVGLPAYNGLPYLEDALSSLRRQDFEDLEIIVCDNASTDGTADLVRDLAVQDRRIRYVRNPQNIGANNNYNKTFSLARGRYFRWAASDDFVSPGVLSRCVGALECDPATILAFPETLLVDARGATLQPYDDGEDWAAPTAAKRFEFSLTRWGYCNVMYGVVRADVLRQTELLGSYPCADLVLQSDLVIRGRFTHIRGEYYHRRIHEGCTDELDAEQLAQFYRPDQTTPFDARLLRMFRQLMRIVWKAPVTLDQKRRMYGALARHAVWARGQLLMEARDVVRKRWVGRHSKTEPGRAVS
jgi:glycosyltransferase involved in cell wall biosynthesis